MQIETNLTELEAHINKVFKGMMKSQEVASAGKEAGKIIGGHVASLVGGGNDAGYDYNQSGYFHELISDESKSPVVKGSQNSLSIGLFSLDNMNESALSMRNAQYQVHEVWDGKNFVRKSIYLKQENQMPKWILAEFGSKHGGSIPPQFDITYTPRPNKDILFGPSLGGVGGPGGGSKKGFFMVSEKTAESLYGPRRDLFSYRTHGGMRAGHVFTKGLEESKKDVYDALAEGISLYLSKN